MNAPTCAATALLQDSNWLLTLLFCGHTGSLQCAAALVRAFVAPAHFVVALARARARLALFVRAPSHALQSGTAAAVRCSPAAAARLPLRGRAHRAAAAGVQQRPAGTAVRRERGAASRLTWPTARLGRLDLGGPEEETEDRQEQGGDHAGPEV